MAYWTAVCELAGMSTLSFSRHFVPEKLTPEESPDSVEKRLWRERLHVFDSGPNKGKLFIPPMAFKLALSAFAKYRGEKIPGKRGATYTKYFDAAVLCMTPAVLDIKKEDVVGEWLFVPSDGKPGGATRVDKCFPAIPEGWKTTAEFTILDATLTEPVFARHLKGSGMFIGIGRFRPARGGYYGRFSVKSMTWTEHADDSI